VSGFTLVEVAMVGMLATVLMLALTGFYINSQSTWIDASAQAVTQRELTFVLQTIADSVHASSSADTSTPGSLVLYDYSPTLPPPEKCWFRWDSTDSLIHVGVGGNDRGPLGASKVTDFEVTQDASHRMVRIVSLQMRSAHSRLLTLSSDAAFFNR
jgi:hypothetical protein